MLTGGVVSEDVTQMAALPEACRAVPVPNHTHTYWSVCPIDRKCSELTGATVSFASNREWMTRVRGSCSPAQHNTRGMSCLAR